MEYNHCRLCNHNLKEGNYNIEVLEILTKKLNNDVSMKIIEYIDKYIYDDSHDLLETRFKEDIDELEHYMEICVENQEIPNKIDFDYHWYRWRRDESFELTVKLLKDNKVIFKLRKEHCDYEYYCAGNFNEFINNFIRKYNLLISTNTDSIILDGVIDVPAWN